MRTVAAVALVALTISASAGCGSPAEPSGALTVTLAPGTSATYGAFVLRFVAVTSDSRCPADALCIQQGDAMVAVEARVRGAMTSFTLQVTDAANRRVVFAGYAVEVQNLTPYPLAATPIAPGDYRLTVTIDRD